VKIERDQEFDPLMHYVWFYEGPQWKQKALAAGVLILIMAVVMFPLWPIVLRQGVWYLSVGLMGLIGLFFVMAIFRLILFCATVFTIPPGLWLYPNLFEDVGFFDSFRPLWGWQEVITLGSKRFKVWLKRTDIFLPADQEEEEKQKGRESFFQRKGWSHFRFGNGS
jgi:protein translocation Sec62 family protein